MEEEVTFVKDPLEVDETIGDEIKEEQVGAS